MHNIVGENIKKLRKELNLTQGEFAKKLDVTNGLISKIEKGQNATDRFINQVCTEFNVNESWLKTGQGKLFKEVEDFELTKMIEKLFSDGDNFLKNVFLTFARLNDSEREVVKKIIKELNKE
ncbi:TPA: helix-turn-helix domain-containing protein [Clostridioides difficile]|nr:helix-turn-helix transcriptional regulator [Clostridioides difficile]HBF4062832.1 helix-turn-helix transcriptional regulator [Clostridioides difficile]